MWGTNDIANNAGLLYINVSNPSSTPIGDVQIAEVQFKILLQGIFPELYYCELYFGNVQILGSVGEIPTHTGSGLIRIVGRIISEFIDLYGGAENNGYGTYPDPFPEAYGGQGFEQPMDLVTPESRIILYAKVTNNTWPIQNNNVTFVLEGPQGYSNVTYALTNEDGVAYVTFEMPWSSENGEDLIGLWNASATASIGEVVVTDRMPFYYSYLVNIYEVTTDKSIYGHGETVEISIIFGTLSMQYYPCLLSTSILDSHNMTIGYVEFMFTVGGASFGIIHWTHFVQQVVIPFFAHSGDADIIVDCFDKQPEQGGFRWCPQYQKISAFIIQDLYHDIEVASVAPAKTIIYQDYSLSINVTLVNKGDYTETFNVTIYANTIKIETQEITLLSKALTTITFTWNTTGFTKGSYSILTQAEPVSGEGNISNNILECWVILTFPGDIDGDATVNFLDAILLGAAFGSEPNDDNWNPNADINNDNIVNYLDAIILGANFGQSL